MVVSSSLILLQVYSSVFYLLFLSAKFNIGEDDFLKLFLLYSLYKLVLSLVFLFRHNSGM